MHNWISTPITADILRGAVELETTAHGVLPRRLPAWAVAQSPGGLLANAVTQPSGVRLVFRTEATAIELTTLRTTQRYVGAPPWPEGVYDLRIDGELIAQASVDGGNVVAIDMATGAAETTPGQPGTLHFGDLPARPKNVEIWLPHSETTELIALRTDAPVDQAPTGDRPVWLHHGSSISQGSNAASPSSIWPAIAATTAEVELINLGFSGNALLDPFTARVMRDTPADVISVKIGINLVNADLMRLRAFAPAVHGFLDTIREGHPHTPLLVVSAVSCPIHEDTPGPGGFDLDALAAGVVRFVATGDPAEADAGRLTLRTIREELARIVAQRQSDDAKLHYLDGRELYGPADIEELPLPDDLHPDTAAHRRIGERFARLAFGEGGALADHSG